MEKPDKEFLQKYLHKEQEKQAELAQGADVVIGAIKEYIGKKEEVFFDLLQSKVDQYDNSKAAVATIKAQEEGLPMERLYTPKEVGEYLHRPVKTIMDWLRDKKLKGVKSGKLWLIKESDLKAYVDGLTCD